MVSISQLRTQERKFKEHPTWVWGVLIILYLFALMQYWGRDVNLFATSMFVLDLLMFCQQFVYYYFHVKVQRQVDEKQNQELQAAINDDVDDDFQQVDTQGLGIKSKMKQQMLTFFIKK